LGQVVAGESNRDIATALFISPKTVSVHVSALLRKFGVRGRGDLSAATPAGLGHRRTADTGSAMESILRSRRRCRRFRRSEASNSAGQAALHLTKHAAHVTLVIRDASLAAGMSDYLVRQIQATPKVAVLLPTQVVSGRGDTRLESLTLEDNQDQQEEMPAAAVFIMIGAKPHTDWLAPALSLDKDGFVLTGRDLPGTKLGAGA
jgi:hypothetical protein